MMAAGVAMTSNISIDAAETMISCVRWSFFLQYDIDATGEEVSNSSPSSTTIKTALTNLAASCLNNRLRQMEGANNLYGTYNKGHRAKVDHFAKILSWWDRGARKTLYVTLDMDPAGNSSEEVAMAVKHSMVQEEVPDVTEGSIREKTNHLKEKRKIIKETIIDLVTTDRFKHTTFIHSLITNSKNCWFDAIARTLSSTNFRRFITIGTILSHNFSPFVTFVIPSLYLLT